MSEERRVALAGLIIALVVATLLLLSNQPVAPDPVFMKPVPVEGVTARRLDEGTFRGRWRPVGELAPGVVIHEVSVPAEPAGATVTSPPPAWSPPPARLTRAVQLRVNGTCARHGMRKVTYGKRWRCRK